jgi:hypothetical protein
LIVSEPEMSHGIISFESKCDEMLSQTYFEIRRSKEKLIDELRDEISDNSRVVKSDVNDPEIC